MAILAALQVLLHRMSGQDDIVIGTPVANRGAPELENVIGPFVNSLALRVNLAENPTFNEFLSQVRQVTIDAIDNREIPFDLVVEAVNPLAHARSCTDISSDVSLAQFSDPGAEGRGAQLYNCQDGDSHRAVRPHRRYGSVPKQICCHLRVCDRSVRSGYDRTTA